MTKKFSRAFTKVCKSSRKLGIASAAASSFSTDSFSLKSANLPQASDFHKTKDRKVREPKRRVRRFDNTHYLYSSTYSSQFLDRFFQ